MHTHITVTAPEGRLTPIAPNDGVDPSAALLLVEPGTVCRVRLSADVRRSLARGDLMPCNTEGKAVKLEEAGCDKQLEDVIEGHYGGDKCDPKKLKEHRELVAKAKADAEAAKKAAAEEAKKAPKTDDASKK
jgi:hypothetical protein